MINNFWVKPFFWIGIYLIGYTITILVFVSPTRSMKIENSIPKKDQIENDSLFILMTDT